MARFFLDAMLGSLATHLRMCGHDAAYALDRGVEGDESIREVAREEGRVLVTRDRDLAARARDAILVESKDIDGQLREVEVAGVELSLTEPTRCSACNGELERVEDGGQTPPHAPDPDENGIWRCHDCGKHFWKGSHWDDVSARLDSL